MEQSHRGRPLFFMQHKARVRALLTGEKGDWGCSFLLRIPSTQRWTFGWSLATRPERTKRKLLLFLSSYFALSLVSPAALGERSLVWFPAGVGLWGTEP